MSYAPQGSDIGARPGQDPPSFLSGFTVEHGFSVIPPKRPTTVTAAATMMFVYSGLAALLGIVSLVTVIGDVDTGHLFAVFRDAAQLFFALALAVGFAMVTVLVLRGRDGARVTAFVLAGAIAFVAVSIVIRGVAGELFTVPGGQDVAALLIASLVLAAVTVTIALLAADRADAWFHEKRGERFINRDTETTVRPRSVIVATVALAVIALAESTELTIQIVDAFATDATYANPTTQIVYFVPDSLPILAATAVATVLLFFNYETARIIAFGLCGAIGVYFVSGVFDLVTVLFGDFFEGMGGMYYLRRSLLLVQIAAAVVVVTGLASKPAAAWFRFWRNVRAEREAPREDLSPFAADSPSPPNPRADSDWP